MPWILIWTSIGIQVHSRYQVVLIYTIIYWSIRLKGWLVLCSIPENIWHLLLCSFFYKSQIRPKVDHCYYIWFGLLNPHFPALRVFKIIFKALSIVNYFFHPLPYSPRWNVASLSLHNYFHGNCSDKIYSFIPPVQTKTCHCHICRIESSTFILQGCFIQTDSFKKLLFCETDSQEDVYSVKTILSGSWVAYIKNKPALWPQIFQQLI